MFGRMVFGEGIRAVEFGLAPINGKLPLLDTTANPIKTHVDGLGALLFDFVVGESFGSSVVGFQGSRWLWMTEFGEAYANKTRFLAVVK